MTDHLPERLLRLHAILHVAAGHGEDDEADAGSLRLALPFRDALTEAASLIQRLEGERDEWKADAKHYISRCGEQQEALETAEQALSASQKEVEAARKALQHLAGLLETAKSAALFTKPQTGRVIVNVEKLEAALVDLRSALQTGGKEHG